MVTGQNGETGLSVLSPNMIVIPHHCTEKEHPPGGVTVQILLLYVVASVLGQKMKLCSA